MASRYPDLDLKFNKAIFTRHNVGFSAYVRFQKCSNYLNCSNWFSFSMSFSKMSNVLACCKQLTDSQLRNKEQAKINYVSWQTWSRVISLSHCRYCSGCGRFISPMQLSFWVLLGWDMYIP